MSLSTEKPILFNTEMVKAILEGRKTQTRRIATSTAELVYKNTFTVPRSKYQKGDILYVRETFIKCDINGKETILFKADGHTELDGSALDIPWTPSIHMKKKDARIFLKVTNVRVERLQDITLADMICEGINHLQEYSTGKVVKPFTQIKREFITLWNSTAKDGYKWEDNPFVFVYEFERINYERFS